MKKSTKPKVRKPTPSLAAPPCTPPPVESLPVATTPSWQNYTEQDKRTLLRRSLGLTADEVAISFPTVADLDAALRERDAMYANQQVAEADLGWDKHEDPPAKVAKADRRVQRLTRKLRSATEL